VDDGHRTGRISASSPEETVFQVREVIGRDAELASVRAFLDGAAAGSSALLLEGEPGIGKSTVWLAALAEARRRSCVVLSCRCAQPERVLSFSGLTDIVGPVLDGVLPQLPQPQARALEIALVRVDPGDAPLDQRAVRLGFLSVLRLLAQSSTVALGIDDVQWLDVATERVLEFAVSRLATEPVAVIMSRRIAPDAGFPAALEAGLRPGRLTRLPLGPLAIGAITKVLLDQVDIGMSRPLLRRVYETSAGNPFYALELARALRARGAEPAIDEPLPVPPGLTELILARMADLSAQTRELLLLAAAAAAPSVALLGEATGGGPVVPVLQQAIDRGIVGVANGGEVHFAHPLWASAAYSAVSLAEQQRAHARLAQVALDPEARARHLALAAERPSEEVAAALGEAARRARARGAIHTAAEHAILAARLTPETEPRWRRRIEAAEYLFSAGDAAAADHLLEELVAELPHGPVRAAARIALGRIRTYNASNRAATEVLRLALDDAKDAPLLLAEIHLTMAWICDFDLAEGLQHADAAVGLLEDRDQPTLLAGALGAKLWLGFLVGDGLRVELAARAVALERQARSVRAVDGIDLPLGALLKAADRLDEARVKLEGVLAAIRKERDDSSRFEVIVELGHLECLAGRWQQAEEYATEAAGFAELTGQSELRPAVLALTATLDALLGRLDRARASAQEGLALAETAQGTWLVLMNLPVLGYLELTAGRLTEAIAHLARADDLCEQIGLREVGRFRFYADYAEALIAVGELERAEEVLARFEARGRAAGRQWALATASRCRVLLLAARGDLAAALAEMEIVLPLHDGLPMPFERARTLLVGGEVHRRARHKREARILLEAAESAFSSLGAAAWAAKARDGLARIGLRPPSPLDLTPTERGVAELAAAGLTNREIADRMFISVRTAESTLSRVYRKLGIRSRAELARDFGARGRAL
jgi:DNA-binding CsgD family transcriptional regulator